MREQRVNEVATTLGLETLLDRKPGALSGGQRQRVAMGRAMVREPKAFLMDEPLSNLDAKLRVSMRAELSRLHERLGVTTVYVTHDQVEAMTLGQRVAVMRDGLLQQVDTPQNLFHHPSNLFVAAFIGSPSMNLVEADVADGAVEFGSYSLALPAGSPMVNASRRVILGMRPTDFEHAAGADPSLPRMRVKADVVEELGAETHIIFAVDAPRVSAEAVAGRRPRTRTARCSPTTSARSSRRGSTAASACRPATRSTSPSIPGGSTSSIPRRARTSPAARWPPPPADPAAYASAGRPGAYASSSSSTAARSRPPAATPRCSGRAAPRGARGRGARRARPARSARPGSGTCG